MFWYRRVSLKRAEEFLSLPELDSASREAALQQRPAAGDIAVEMSHCNFRWPAAAPGSGAKAAEAGKTLASPSDAPRRWWVSQRGLASASTAVNGQETRASFWQRSSHYLYGRCVS